MFTYFAAYLHMLTESYACLYGSLWLMEVASWVNAIDFSYHLNRLCCSIMPMSLFLLYVV